MSDDDETYQPQTNDENEEYKQNNSSADNNYNSSSDGEQEDNPFSDTEESDNTKGIDFTSIHLATTTCLHKYAIARMEGAENNSLPWPPIMLVILTHLNRSYKRRELVTERNIAMLELLLHTKHAPIQLRIRRAFNTEGIDLNNDESLDFTGMSFAEALEILRDLLVSNIIKHDHIRAPVQNLL